MSDLLGSLLVYNCDDSAERFRLEQEIKKSDEWLKLAKKVAKAQTAADTPPSTDLEKADDRRSEGPGQPRAAEVRDALPAPATRKGRVKKSGATPWNSDPDIIKRRAIVKQNRKVKAQGLCELFDSNGIPLAPSMKEAGTWAKAYKASIHRPAIHSLLTRDRKSGD